MTDLTCFIKSIDISCLKNYEELIKDLRELIALKPFKSLYRGHSSRNYKLKSSLFRESVFELEDILRIEKHLFDEFQVLYERKPEITIPHDSELKNGWHTYFQSQHLGLKTRLLDWTSSYFIALWFAVEDESYWDKDGSVWLFVCPNELYVNAEEKLKEITESYHPLFFKEDRMINVPTYLINSLKSSLAQNRIRNQYSHFWIQSDENSTIPMTEHPDFKNLLFEIEIKREYKATLKEELANENFIKKDVVYDNQDPVLQDVELLNKKYI